jgi:hypothetical protein
MTLLSPPKKVKTIKRKWHGMFVQWAWKSASGATGTAKSSEKVISYTSS